MLIQMQLEAYELNFIETSCLHNLYLYGPQVDVDYHCVSIPYYLCELKYLSVEIADILRNLAKLFVPLIIISRN